ncbi:MAG TPA: deoxynucleoside kinase [Anaerolineales bacterium]|nr:deoxynucleoside kinase [Anaerolineales bacterium]
MGKLIMVVGNSGVGKTALTQALCAAGDFAIGMEGHLTRPFQALFKNDPTYALANQIDYLLLRAEQERRIRSLPKTGLQDGGLELDFFVFTRLFLRKGLLKESEFELCERLYQQVRASQPPPDGILWLEAPLEVIAGRFTRRGRPLEIATRDDLQAAGTLLQDWLGRVEPARLLRIDASQDDPGCQFCLPQALEFISKV